MGMGFNHWFGRGARLVLGGPNTPLGIRPVQVTWNARGVQVVQGGKKMKFESDVYVYGILDI
jgi:hypothetical protein